MSQITELASGQLTPTDAISVILSQPDDMPSSVIVHWPIKPTVIDPKSFGDSASIVVKLFADAHIALAGLRARRSR
jgi:hypothetical protein